MAGKRRVPRSQRRRAEKAAQIQAALATALADQAGSRRRERRRLTADLHSAFARGITQAPAAGMAAPAARPVAAAARAGTGTIRHGWQRRRQLAPAYAMAATLTGGSILHAAGQSPLIGLTAPAVAGGVACAAAWRGSSPVRRLYAAAATGYAGLWTSAVTAWGPAGGGAGDAVLLAGGTLLAAPWWYANRWRWEPPPALLPGEQGHAEDLDPRREFWLENIAAAGCAFPGTDLDDFADVVCGWQADILLPRKKDVKTTADAIAAGPKVSAAYDKPATQVIIEATPDGRQSRARLTVLEQDPFQAGHLWTGPTLDAATGMAEVGMFPDGTPARYQLWTPGSGACHSLVSGTTGSGKSRFLDMELCEIHLSPLIVAWLIDPQEGQSLPDWTDAADRYAAGENGDYEPCMQVLRAMRRVMIRRSRHLGQLPWQDGKGRWRKGRSFFDPTPQMPLLRVIVDEAHVLLKHQVHSAEALSILADTGKLGRKTGVGVELVSLVPSLDELGGPGAQVLRDMLREGNVVCFRTGNSVATHMLGLHADPSRLPRRFADGSKTHGLGYILGADDRQAPFRSKLVRDPFDIAERPAAGHLDQMSADAADAPDDEDRAPRSFHVPGVAQLRPMTAEEKRRSDDLVLAVFTDDAERSLGEVIAALPAATSDRTIRWALKRLVDEGYLATDGDKKPYRITGNGRERRDRAGAG